MDQEKIGKINIVSCSALVPTQVPGVTQAKG